MFLVTFMASHNRDRLPADVSVSLKLSKRNPQAHGSAAYETWG